MGSLGTRPQWHPHPEYHLKAPRGWMNDPCAPGYDATTGTYHLFYQWNPSSCDWGNIAWGQYTSTDGVYWERNGSEPVLESDQPYDKDGIFTGCMHSTGPRGEKGQLTVFYSSVCSLPIHWTKPYVRNCEGLALATSVDGGRTWCKSPLNPILKGEPEGLVVTGFRDPYLAEWPGLDQLRGEESPKLYGILSGGVLQEGPNAFVYVVSPDDLTKWTYLGPLVDIPTGYQRPAHWTGDFGVNWECVNFMSLSNQCGEYDVLIMGSEGGYRRGYNERKEDEDPHGVWCLWMAGSLHQTSKGPRLRHEFSGMLDNGNFYAANSYHHPISKSRIVWGWIKEEELVVQRRESKGWAGYLSLPREIYMLCLENVVRALKTPLAEISSTKVVGAGANGTKSKVLQTLGIRPSRDLDALRRSAPTVWSNTGDKQQMGSLITTQSPNWELEAVIKVRPGSHRCVGLHLRHNEAMSQCTSVFFSPDREEIVVDRSRSNFELDIKKDSLAGPFTLFTFARGGTEVLEDLHLRIFSDGDVLEVFANDRFALSTTVYCDVESCSGISWFVEGNQEGRVVFETIRIWENLANVQRIKS